MREIKVGRPFDCPFLQRDDQYPRWCTLTMSRFGWEHEERKCSETGIPSWCPLRSNSVLVNIGSMGVADAKGNVG